MYVFSANATARVPQAGVPAGQRMPFMVYINFLDMFGAEQLCKMYLMKAGFTDVEIEKRKFFSRQMLEDEQLLLADPALNEALQSGYMIRMFDEEDGLH